MNEFNPFAEPDKNFDRELTPEGAHAARCVRVIEIGKQYSKLYDNESNKTVIVLSIPGVTMNIGGEQKQKFMSNPFGITISNNERAAMRQWARALCPKGGSSFSDFLNQPCQIVVRHQKKDDGRVLEKIDSIAPILPGIEVGPLDTEPFWFQWNDPDPEILAKVPEFTRNLMKEATNYHGSKVEEAMKIVESGADSSDDVPF